MSNSHEQSLDENAIFFPVSESSPDFLYSETERLAVERLLNGGPESFYSAAGSEHCFLSQEEVTDITNWAQDYHLSPLSKEEHWDNGYGPDLDGYCSTYYPAHSDTPPPGLALGWAERNPWGQKDSVKVYTSPTAEGEPSVRELIRRHLQGATQLIAIVTDSLTDGTVLGDLHNAASRGVPVYIILNQRSTQENTVHRLRHPNIQVRVLGGKSFCSRAGRMVVGEMKDKFVLVDLQTVIHGSYSLTWSDAHLHRQLVTVLTGAVVDSFDQEFRILFAASSPVPESKRTSRCQITNHVNNFSDLWFPKQLSFLDAEINNPPSPPSDTLLDWEAMGVITGGCSVPNSPLELHEDVLLKDKPVLNNAVTDKKNKFVDHFFSNKHLEPEKKRFSEPPPPISPVSNYVSNLIATNSKPKPSLKEQPSPEMIKDTRIEPMVEKTVARQISQENTKYDKYLKRPEKEPEPVHKLNAFSLLKREPVLKEELTVKGVTSRSKDGSDHKMENTPSSRKPVIIMMPHTQDTSSLSDILMRMKMKQSSLEHPKEHPKEQPREFLRELSKEQPKEPPKDQLKEHPKEPPKDHPREFLREHSKEHPKQLLWENPREFSKVRPKEQQKEEPKELPREFLRENSKERPKEQPKEQSKERPKQLPWELPREYSKVHPKEQPKELPREFLRENSKEHPKELSKERPKDHPWEFLREYSKEHPKKHPKELPKENSKEHPKEHPKELSKERPKNHSWEFLRQYSKEHPKELPGEHQRERSRAFSELSWSMVDVSVKSPTQDEKTSPVPRFRAGTLDVESLTPALALMQKRNDFIRSSMFRSPLNYQPRDRPRSYAFSPDWKGSLSELDTQGEGH